MKQEGSRATLMKTKSSRAETGAMFMKGEALEPGQCHFRVAPQSCS